MNIKCRDQNSIHNILVCLYRHLIRIEDYIESSGDIAVLGKIVPKFASLDSA